MSQQEVQLRPCRHCRQPPSCRELSLSPTLPWWAIQCDTCNFYAGSERRADAVEQWQLMHAAKR